MATSKLPIAARVARGSLPVPPASPVGTQPYLEAEWRGLALFISPSGHASFDEAEIGNYTPSVRAGK